MASKVLSLLLVGLFGFACFHTAEGFRIVKRAKVDTCPDHVLVNTKGDCVDAVTLDLTEGCCKECVEMVQNAKISYDKQIAVYMGTCKLTPDDVSPAANYIVNPDKICSEECQSMSLEEALMEFEFAEVEVACSRMPQELVPMEPVARLLESFQSAWMECRKEPETTTAEPETTTMELSTTSSAMRFPPVQIVGPHDWRLVKDSSSLGEGIGYDKNELSISVVPPGIPMGTASITDLMLSESSRCPSGFDRVQQVSSLNGDLNQGAGGKYIYLCAKKGGSGAPITGLKLSESSTCPSGFDRVHQVSSLNGDLNQQAGGKDIYLCAKKAGSGDPIRDLKLSESSTCPSGWNRVDQVSSLNGDLNQQAFGKYIYLCEINEAPFPMEQISGWQYAATSHDVLLNVKHAVFGGQAIRLEIQGEMQYGGSYQGAGQFLKDVKFNVIKSHVDPLHWLQADVKAVEPMSHGSATNPLASVSLILEIQAHGTIIWKVQSWRRTMKYTFWGDGSIHSYFL